MDSYVLTPPLSKQEIEELKLTPENVRSLTNVEKMSIQDLRDRTKAFIRTYRRVSRTYLLIYERRPLFLHRSLRYKNNVQLPSNNVSSSSSSISHPASCKIVYLYNYIYNDTVRFLFFFLSYWFDLLIHFYFLYFYVRIFTSEICATRMAIRFLLYLV